MPSYDYECKKCKYSITIIKKISEPELTECPKCESKTDFEQVFKSAPKVIYNGAWFSTTGKY